MWTDAVMYERQAKKFCNPCLLEEGQELKDAESVKGSVICYMSQQGQEFCRIWKQAFVGEPAELKRMHSRASGLMCTQSYPQHTPATATTSP